MKEIFTAIAFAVLLTAVPALAADTSTNNKPASSTSSGPGVKGAPGNKNGPAAQPNSMDKAGSSSGTADTQPSQDAKGVKGAPGNKSGPAEKPPPESDFFALSRKLATGPSASLQRRGLLFERKLIFDNRVIPCGRVEYTLARRTRA